MFLLTFMLYSGTPKGQTYKQRNNQQAPERSEPESVTKLRWGNGLAKIFLGVGSGTAGVVSVCLWKRRRE